jgi:hypothetical protein
VKPGKKVQKVECPPAEKPAGYFMLIRMADREKVVNAVAFPSTKQYFTETDKDEVLANMRLRIAPAYGFSDAGGYAIREYAPGGTPRRCSYLIDENYEI